MNLSLGLRCGGAQHQRPLVLLILKGYRMGSLYMSELMAAHADTLFLFEANLCMSTVDEMVSFIVNGSCPSPGPTPDPAKEARCCRGLRDASSCAVRGFSIASPGHGDALLARLEQMDAAGQLLHFQQRAGNRSRSLFTLAAHYRHNVLKQSISHLYGGGAHVYAANDEEAARIRAEAAPREASAAMLRPINSTARVAFATYSRIANELKRAERAERAARTLGLPPPVNLSYEALQADPKAELTRLILAASGQAGRGEGAAPTFDVARWEADSAPVHAYTPTAQQVKVHDERLSVLLPGYREIKREVASRPDELPCLHELLMDAPLPGRPCWMSLAGGSERAKELRGLYGEARRR